MVEVRKDHATFATEKPDDSSFLMLNFTVKFQWEDKELGHQIREGYRMKNMQFSANKSPYLRNGAR